MPYHELLSEYRKLWTGASGGIVLGGSSKVDTKGNEYINKPLILAGDDNLQKKRDCLRSRSRPVVRTKMGWTK